MIKSPFGVKSRHSSAKPRLDRHGFIVTCCAEVTLADNCGSVEIPLASLADLASELQLSIAVPWSKIVITPWGARRD